MKICTLRFKLLFMSGDIPPIEELIKHHGTDKSGPFTRASKMQRTMADVNRKYEEEETARKAVSHGYEYINLHGFPIDLEALALISKEDAIRALALPFHHESGEVKVGAVDLTTPELKRIRAHLESLKYNVKLYFISHSSFKETVENYSRVVRAKKIDPEHIKISNKELVAESEKFKQLVKAKDVPVALDATEGLTQLLSHALHLEASDVHIEPEVKGDKVRFRIDGILQDVAVLPKILSTKLVGRIKILGRMKLNVTNVPQDGSFSIIVQEQNVDFRVSVLPSVYGEAVVIRVLAHESSMSLDELGLVGLARTRLTEALEKTTGMILTTGPTGSGKTTTLYALLQILNKPGVKIITIEDPVEYKIEGVSQTPIDKKAGMTFASSLRAILRQDPDVVMVGEIRDHETADTAVQAALTGHVVLSTLHTNDAASIIPRLIDLDIKPFLITAAIKIGMAQRLVRRMCQHCKVGDEPDEKIMNKIKAAFDSIPPSSGIKAPTMLKFYASHGCDKCHNLGYKGRIGIYEAFAITAELEKLILREAPLSELKKQAIADGMVTMLQDGLFKALDGITDVYEVFRVTD